MKYPIFRIDFNGGNYTKEGVLEESIESYIAGWEEIYGSNPIYTTTGDRFKEVLRRAYQQTGRRAVVLIDEYDKPILDVLDTGYRYKNKGGDMELLEDCHRNILRAFYSTFKGADEYLKFVLLTGVTKFSQVSVFSGFNQPKDISMDGRYEALCGIPYDAHGYGKNEKATEKHFQYTFYLILRLLGVYCLRIEERQSRGRVDCILETKEYVYIFEFKLNGSADEALKQIEDKGYAKPYLTDARKVVCIGVNFSSETGTVEGWKEV